MKIISFIFVIKLKQMRKGIFLLLFLTVVNSAFSQRVNNNGQLMIEKLEFHYCNNGEDVNKIGKVYEYSYDTNNDLVSIKSFYNDGYYFSWEKTDKNKVEFKFSPKTGYKPTNKIYFILNRKDYIEKLYWKTFLRSGFYTDEINYVYDENDCLIKTIRTPYYRKDKLSKYEYSGDYCVYKLYEWSDYCLDKMKTGFYEPKEMENDGEEFMETNGSNVKFEIDYNTENITNVDFPYIFFNELDSSEFILSTEWRGQITRFPILSMNNDSFKYIVKDGLIVRCEYYLYNHLVKYVDIKYVK